MVSPTQLVTARHVIEAHIHRGITPTIKRRDGGECELVGSHLLEFDAAIVTVTGCEDIPPIRITPGEIKPGLKVLAAGHPLGIHWVVTTGVIATEPTEHGLVFSAPVNRGMSGGPIVNEYGLLVGMTTGIASTDGFWGGLSYGVHAHAIADALEE